MFYVMEITIRRVRCIYKILPALLKRAVNVNSFKCQLIGSIMILDLACIATGKQTFPPGCFR